MLPRTRLLLVTTHRWLGLVLLVWFVLLGLTGSLLVYRDELDVWLNPGLAGIEVRSGPGAARKSATSAGHQRPQPIEPIELIERVLAVTLKNCPQASVERLVLPNGAISSVRVLIRERADLRIGSRRLEAWVSADGQLWLGARPIDGYGLDAPRLARTVHDLHHRLLLGNTGKTAVGIAGTLLLLMIALGLVVALPRKAGWPGWRTMIGIKAGAHPARLIFDVHRSVGVVAFALLLTSACTGIALAFPDYARDVLGLFSPVRPLPVVPFVQREDTPDARLSPLLEGALSRYPGLQLTEVHLPQRRSGSLVLHLRGPSDWQSRGDTLLLLDPVSGQTRLAHDDRSRSLGEKVFHSLLPIHNGVAWGEAGRALMCMAGLLPLLLSVTGVLIWQRKRRAASLARSRRKPGR